MHCLERCKLSSKAVEKQGSKPTELQPSVQLLPALISSHPRPSPSFSPQIPTLDCKLRRQIIGNQGLTKQNQHIIRSYDSRDSDQKNKEWRAKLSLPFAFCLLQAVLLSLSNGVRRGRHVPPGHKLVEGDFPVAVEVNFRHHRLDRLSGEKKKGTYFAFQKKKTCSF